MSNVTKTRQIVRRQNIAGMTAFTLNKDRSLAAYLWRTLLETKIDLNTRPLKLTALNALQSQD